MKRLAPSILAILLSAFARMAAAGHGGEGSPASPGSARLTLASTLRDSGEYALSALEYRRIAADLEPGDPSIPSLLLAAADAYRLQGRWDRMTRMLDAAEDAASRTNSSFAGAHLFLRLRRAEGLHDWTSAAYYAEDLASAASDESLPDLSAWASRAAAADHLRAGDETAARDAAGEDPAAVAAIDRYAAGHDKSPTVGGLLGLIPGLGYAYSGEWGNMARSLFLNGIFGWAMFECADHRRWGLFAITTFFEFTWYTGSVYGGIDAAHRYNRQRQDEAAGAILDGPEPRLCPDTALNFFSLRLSF